MSAVEKPAGAARTELTESTALAPALSFNCLLTSLLVEGIYEKRYLPQLSVHGLLAMP